MADGCERVAAKKTARQHQCIAGRLPASISACENAPMPAGVRSGREQSVQLKRETSGGRRTSGRRGTDEEPRWTLLPGGDRLGLRRGRAHWNQDHRCSSHRGRRRRVHHHAQRAMIRVVLRSVQVRHLHHSHKGKQHHAHQRHHRPRAGAAAPCCPEWLSDGRQIIILIFQGYTKVGRRAGSRGFSVIWFPGVRLAPTSASTVRLN
jgi:hypothetical protein